MEKLNTCKAVITVMSVLTFQRLTAQEREAERRNMNELITMMDRSGGVTVKYFWIAATVQENGLHYAFAFRVSENDNLKCRLEGVQNLCSANIIPSKKAACELVNHWNACFKANGTYLFNEPGF